MTTIEQVAQVLEDAAQLYQDEQINWCSGAWYQDPTGSSDGGNLRPDTVLSVCASTALGLAAGLGVLVPEFLEDNSRFTRPDLSIEDRQWHWAYVWSEEGIQRYRDTRAVIEERLEELHGVGYLPEFNDASSALDENLAPIPVRTKQEIIDLFKDTAKELRNGNQG